MDEDFMRTATRLVVEVTNASITGVSAMPADEPERHGLDPLTRLYLLHGKQFAAASSISHFGAEPILRLRAEGTGQCVFQVGPYLVIPPPAMFCSCSAFHFAMVNRQSSWGCKHVMALQLALQLDAIGGAPSRRRQQSRAPRHEARLQVSLDLWGPQMARSWTAFRPSTLRRRSWSRDAPRRSRTRLSEAAAGTRLLTNINVQFRTV
jgi:hypothetical protein